MKFKTITLLALAALVSMACGGKDNPVTPSITISGSRSLSVPAEGAKETVSFTSSLSWVASADVSWIHLDKTSGTGGSASVEVTVDRNYEADRSGNVTFTVSGSSVSATVTVAQAGVENVDPDDPPIVQGDPVLSVDFTKGLGDFEVQDKDKGGFPGAIWGTNASHPEYGAVAQAYVSATASRYKTESWLLSPRINLKGHDQLYLRFREALNYCNGETVTNFISVKISADKGQTWDNLTIPKLPSGSSFEFSSSGDIDLKAYKDKVIQLAFVYKSTTTTTPTWEITEVLITKEEEVITKDDFGDEYTGVPAWMELPQVKEGDKYYIHTAPIGQVNYRNYSFVYDADALVAPWVAYPLCDLYTKNTVKRSDNWVVDPFVPVQADVTAGSSYAFSSNGYDRGHQIASADRLASSVMNQQTFYWTNVTPQLSNFNQGIWEKLEEQVREWSKSSNGTDTLYVVTGCVVGESAKKVSDHNGKQVSVPDAYYKALLRVSKGAYLGAGFYMEHKNYSDKKFENYSCSLAELEEKVGMKFFVNLPTETATTVKAAKPADNAFWNRTVAD